MDFEKLIKMVKDYEAYKNSPAYHEDNDWLHYIAEEAVTAVLGEDFWKRK